MRKILRSKLSLGKIAVGLVAFNALLLILFFFQKGEVERTAAKIDYLKSINSGAIKLDPSTVILGDSTVAFSVDPRELGTKTLSIALPGATMMISHFLLEQYLKLNPAPKCLLLSTSYIDYYYDQYFWQNYLGTNFFDWSDIQHFYSEAQNHQLFPASDYSELSYKLKSFIFRYLYLSPYKKMLLKHSLGLSSLDYERYRFIQRELDHSRGFTGYAPGKSSEKFISWRHDYLFKPFRPIATDDYYLKKIAERLSFSKTRLIFFEVPIFEINDQRVSSFHREHLKHIQELLARYPETEVVTFSKVYPKEKFRDLTHFNTLGATEFSRDVKRAVEDVCPL